MPTPTAPNMKASCPILKPAADSAEMRRYGVRNESTAREVRGTDTDALRRFLFIYQHLMTSVVDRIEQIPSLIDPLTCDPKFLSWIASWVGFTLDESLPLHQQRELVRRAIRPARSPKVLCSAAPPWPGAAPRLSATSAASPRRITSTT